MRLLWLALAVVFLGLPRPAAADEDFVLVLRALRDQFSRRQFPHSESPQGIDSESEAMVRKVALPLFFKDERLNSLAFGQRLDRIREALGPELVELDPLAAVDAYAAASGDEKRFAYQLTRLGWRNSPKWKHSEVKKAVARTFIAVRDTVSEGLELNISGRYHQATWSFDISAAWFPGSRRVTLYVVGSSPCPGGRTKSLTLKLTGLAVLRSALSPKARTIVVSLEDVDFDARDCRLTLGGRWIHRFEPNSGVSVTLTNNLNLQLVGEAASGKLVQDVLITDPKGRVSGGRLTYSLSGHLGFDGQFRGKFEAIGDSKALSWLDDPAPNHLEGTWSGKLDRGAASGSLTLRDRAISFPWEAREQK